MNPHTQAILDILRDLLADDALWNAYGIGRDDDAPLDRAIYAWADAGCPDATVVPAGSGTGEGG